MTASKLRSFVPVSLTSTVINDRFWKPRLEINRTVTLPIEYEQCRKTGRFGALKMTWKPGQPNPPHQFWDSDIAKWIEAVGYTLATHPDRKLQRLVDGIVNMYTKVQRKDGYLSTHYVVVEPEKRWTNLRDMHELYTAGHLMEGAVALYQGTGDRRFLDVMCRFADHIDSVFGVQRGKKRGYCGHEEIELALVKLYRATSQKRYLKLAKYFVDERGRSPHYFDQEARARGEDPKKVPVSYDPYQAHAPVRKQRTAEGHAVRAMYLFSGMADVALETGDRLLLNACRRLWKNVTRRRMYVTGGVGSTEKGERFTFDYDLPNETAYAETCAAIGLVFWAHRMLQIERDGEYADVMERALYNGILSGVSLDGKRFFYANHLSVYPEALKTAPGHISATRQEWFGCACCPPNVARLLASFGQYIYSQGTNEAYVHLYVQGQAQLDLGGVKVTLRQKTGYPWKERVRIVVRPERPARFTVAVRIPAWCRGAQMKINDRPVDIKGMTSKGYAKTERLWSVGDVVALTFPMPVEQVEAHVNVRMDAGRVALQRGPIVYCLEETDNGPNLSDIALVPNPLLKVRFAPKLLGGVAVITGKAVRRNISDHEDSLYRPARGGLKSCLIKAVPYCTWCNREPGEMTVWIRKLSAV